MSKRKLKKKLKSYRKWMKRYRKWLKKNEAWSRKFAATRMAIIRDLSFRDPAAE